MNYCHKLGLPLHLWFLHVGFKYCIGSTEDALVDPRWLLFQYFVLPIALASRIGHVDSTGLKTDGPRRKVASITMRSYGCEHAATKSVFSEYFHTLPCIESGDSLARINLDEDPVYWPVSRAPSEANLLRDGIMD